MLAATSGGIDLQEIEGGCDCGSDWGNGWVSDWGSDWGSGWGSDCGCDSDGGCDGGGCGCGAAFVAGVGLDKFRTPFSKTARGAIDLVTLAP